MIPESLVKNWASSTQNKIQSFVDEYLISSPQQNIRQITQRLLASLFRKGNEQQRQNVMKLLTQRVKSLSSMGKASKEFLALITHIFETLPAEQSEHQQHIFSDILGKTKEIFQKVVSHRQYSFYSSCANMIDFGGQFKPYLLQANGCLQCFGRPELDFETKSISSVKQELRAHLNGVQWILKRRYEMRGLQLTFVKKKLNFKTMIIYYLDQQGLKIQLGRFGPNDNIPPFDITTSTIGIQFQFAKARKNHINCMVCSASEEYAVLCSNCCPKIIELQGRMKIVGGSPEKIHKELIASSKTLAGMREQLRQFVVNVADQTRITPLRGDIVQDMTNTYSNIIQNMRLLRTLSPQQLRDELKEFSQVSSDSYSSHFYELTNCLQFLLSSFKTKLYRPNLSVTTSLLGDFRVMLNANKIRSLNDTLGFILGQLFSAIEHIDLQTHLSFDASNAASTSQLLINLIQHLKINHKTNTALLNKIKNYVLNTPNAKYFSLKDRIKLFIMIILDQEQLVLINEQQLKSQKFQELKRLSMAQYQQYEPLTKESVKQIFTFRLDNWIKLFLSILPEELIPQSNLQIQDPQFLRFIKTVPPLITQNLVYSNIVFTPNPIIKLNAFKLLPKMVQLLPLEASIQVIKQLCRYRNLWNTHVYEAVQRFDKMLEDVQKERRLALCLQGYDCSQENFYFDHIFRILTPQRPDFIIRLQIPQKQMQKAEKNQGGPTQYIYLPIRQVRSQDLKGDTMGALHEWIAQQIKKQSDMPFDLIVENTIVDNLDLSLEIIYRKVVKNQVKRQIGTKQYDFFRVIYRIQGVFGQANEKNCGNPRDQKLQECITFSSYLLNKLPNKKTGLDVLMGIIPTLDRTPAHRQRKNKILKILQIIFMNETIIRKVVQWQYGNDVLGLVVKFISLQKNELSSTQSLLEMASQIVDEANKEMVRLRKGSEGVMKSQEQGNQQSSKAVKYVLQKVRQAQNNRLRNISKKLIKILPFCSKDDMAAARYLFDYFQIGKLLQLRFSDKLSLLQEFMQVLSESYLSFKQICKEQGITDQVIDLISSGGLESLQKTRSRQDLEILEICLIFLKGLVQGDFQLQEVLFERGVLQQIYKVASVGSKEFGRIPSICFQIVKYFQEGKMISPVVHDFFSNQQEQKKKRIQDQKEERKKAILMKKNKAMKEWQSLINKEEQELLSCSTCKQGYGKKKDVMGVYLYTSKTDIPAPEHWWNDNKKIQGVTSTSYFEPIHLQCHNEAMKDDLKMQKGEWDGALIRNSQVLCNNWCPFKGPQTTDQEFDKAIRKYFERAGKGCAYWIVINDLNGLLDKFSKQYNFALQTKGSSHTHNAKLIPVLIGFTAHLLKNNEEIKYLREGMAFVEQQLPKKPNLIHLYFCGLLFTCTLSQLASKRQFCLRLIDHLGYGNFKDLKPFYIYLAMIQSIMKATHKNIGEAISIHQHLTSFIAKNNNQLIGVFEHIAEDYKNIYVKWDNVEQAKKFFVQ